jgi:hypothetical protein
MESAYTLYIDESGIVVAPALEQVRWMALDHLREDKHQRTHPTSAGLVVHDESRRDFAEEIQP